MARRQQIDQAQGAHTAAAISVRQKQEGKVFELGWPLSPEQYAYNDRPVWAEWKAFGAKLYAKRLLSYADGEALLAMARARVAGDEATRKRIFTETWQKRKPFPAPVVAGASLTAFIGGVAEERDSFQSRMVPSETICRELDGREHEFPDGDATTIAKQYARDVLDGGIVAGELVKRACVRFLDDLEHGHTRGIYWDVVAARNIVQFAREFGGLPNLLAWQVWVLTNIFAFKRASGFRRFTEVWLSMGRKNGKTRTSAVVGLFLLVADQEKYAEIYASATAKEQSRICWRDARRCITDSPELSAHVTRWAGDLMVKDTDSHFQNLASEERSFLGVRGHGLICDEVGVWQDRNAFDALVQSTVSRRQPLTFSITTAPESKLTFAWEKFSWCEKILRGIVQAEHCFVAVYRLDEADSPTDLTTLAKANPSLGVTLLEEHLLKQIAELETTPSGLNNWLQFHCNITPERTLQRVGSIVAAKWDACSGLDLIAEMDTRKAVQKFLLLNADTPCFAGLDYGAVSDLTCLALVFPRARFTKGGELLEKKVIVGQGFMPEIGILAKEQSWGIPLSQWTRSGFIDLLPGDMVDPELVRDYIIKTLGFVHMQELGFDPWGVPQTMAKLQESGAVQCVAVPQTPKVENTAALELALNGEGPLRLFLAPVRL